MTELYNNDELRLKPMVILCDIDGTAADFADRDRFDWSRVIEDEPITPVIETVSALVETGYQVIFLTGRSEECRKDTIAWIKFFMPRVDFVDPDKQLFMRPENDYRKGTELKREIYEREIAPNYNVLLVLEDHNRIVEMWREMGLTCLQPQEGNF